MADNAENATPPVDQPGWLMRLWRGWVKPLAIMFAVLFTVRSAVADWNDVPSQSMEPTLLVGDRIFVNKLAYGLRVPFTMQYVTRWDEPMHGEIVVFHHPENDKRMVKRIIGVPGDRVSMTQGRLMVNGVEMPTELLDESASPSVDLSDPPPHRFVTETLGDRKHATMYLPWRARSRSFEDRVVPEDHFMVLGDNRDNSRDSRSWGFVHKDRIVGRVVGVAFSLDRDGGWSPRWDRFASGVD